MSSEHYAIYMLPSLEGLDEKKEKGRGSYGAVYEVKLNGLPCIAKGIHDILLTTEVSSVERQMIRGKFFEECLLLSSLRHPNIVQFLGVHQCREDTYLVMEYMHISLDQCLNEYPDIPLPFKTSIAQDVSYGLLHLHSLHPPIIHRDLSAANILLTEGMRAKIADLGVSKAFNLQLLHKLSGQTIQPGTLAYMPPEALTEKPVYDLKLDIFSFGALLLYIATQVFPTVYEVSINDKTREAIKNHKFQILRRKCWIEQMGNRHPFYLVVIQCLQDRPEARPTTLALNETISRLHSKQTKEWNNILELHLQLKTSKVQLQKATSEVENVTSECQKFKTSRAELELHTSEARSYKDQLDILQNEHQKLITEKEQLSMELKDKKKEYLEKQKQLEDEVHGWSRAVYEMETELKALKKKLDDNPVPMPKPLCSNTAAGSRPPLQSDELQADITHALGQIDGIEANVPSLHKLLENKSTDYPLPLSESVTEEGLLSSQSQKKTPENAIIPSVYQNKVQQKAKEEDTGIKILDEKPMPIPKPRSRSNMATESQQHILPLQSDPQLSHQVQSRCAPPVDIIFALGQEDGIEAKVSPSLHKLPENQIADTPPLPLLQPVTEKGSFVSENSSQSKKKTPENAIIPSVDQNKVHQKAKEENKKNEKDDFHKPALPPKPRSRSNTVTGLLPTQRSDPQLSEQMRSENAPPFGAIPVTRQKSGIDSNADPPLYNSTADQGVSLLSRSQSVVEEHSSTHSRGLSQLKKKPVGGVLLLPIPVEQKLKDESTENNLLQTANRSTTKPPIKAKPSRYPSVPSQGIAEIHRQTIHEGH